MSAYDSWRFEVSSADPDAAVPVWVNLTAWVRTVGAGARPVQNRRGRGSEREDIQPSTLAIVLENTDHRFLPGNPTSPYVAWWGQARKCRFVETANGVDFVRFTGYLKPLDLPDWAEPGVEQFVTVSAVDWLGRLDRAPAFTGTLGEHVRTAGGTLVEHFPLDDPYPHSSLLSLASLTRVVVGFNVAVATEPQDLVQANAQPGPPGDDQSYIKFVPISDGSNYLARARLEGRVTVPVGATDTVAISVWLYATHPADSATFRTSVVTLWTDIGVGAYINNDSSDGTLEFMWRGTLADTTIQAGRPLEREAWRLVTVRINAATGAMDLWSGSDVAVSGTASAAPGAITLTRLGLQSLWEGADGQLQVRVGPAATTMTRAMHLAQYAHGTRGLHRQTVAQRIATLAGYAGVPAADLDLDGRASTPMQRARLARQRPAAALRAAADADGGARLFTRGTGPIALLSRQARYDQPVTLQIPYAWLLRGLRYREDVPINDVVATQASGSPTRRTDAASVRRYGTGGDTATLDTAIDADPANYASWTVRANATPRLRCPQLVVDLLPRTPAERAQLLALDIGHRIEITGGPATIPTAARHLIIEGVADETGVQTRTITFNTSPLLGPTAGTPPGCPVVGAVRRLAINPNSGFEDGTVSGWSADGGATLDPSSVRAYEGSWSMRITPPGGVVLVGARTVSLPVTALTWYLASGWAFVPAGWSDISIAVDWRTSVGGAISSSFGATTAAPAGAWVYLSLTAQAPATAAFAQLRVRVGGTAPASVQVWADEVDLAPATLVGASTVIAY